MFTFLQLFLIDDYQNPISVENIQFLTTVEESGLANLAKCENAKSEKMYDDFVTLGWGQ